MGKRELFPGKDAAELPDASAVKTLRRAESENIMQHIIVQFP